MILHMGVNVCKGMVLVMGVAKVTHLNTKQFWVQGAIHNRALHESIYGEGRRGEGAWDGMRRNGVRGGWPPYFYRLAASKHLAAAAKGPTSCAHSCCTRRYSYRLECARAEEVHHARSCCGRARRNILGRRLRPTFMGACQHPLHPLHGE